MKNNIVLIGFMCTGKTTVGRLVSEKLNFKFIDTDLEIEKSTGSDIDEIFQAKGEEYFRFLETLTIREASVSSHAVISCGGGAVKNGINIEKLKRNGIIFCLKSDIDTIYERAVNSKEVRPLVKDKSKMYVKELMDQREILYTSSTDFIIDTQNRSMEDIADEIIEIYNVKTMQ